MTCVDNKSGADVNVKCDDGPTALNAAVSIPWLINTSASLNYNLLCGELPWSLILIPVGKVIRIM